MNPASPQKSAQAGRLAAEGRAAEQVLHIAVLMTCFNRRESTLRCVQSFAPQRSFRLGEQPVQCQLFLLDNGTDGTADLVKSAFADVVVQQGQPDWYWNQGMLKLWQRVMASHRSGHFDYFLWLNDDVQLMPDALPRLLASTLALTAQHAAPVGAVVGTMADRSTAGDAGAAIATYGGRLRRSRFNPLAFGPVLSPTEHAQPCDFINGNLCLIPAAATRAIGLLSADFSHGCGDFDYGLRLQQAGFGLWVAPGFYGLCKTNPAQGSVFDAAVPMAQRLALALRPNVLPPAAEWRRFVRRHGGWSWPLACSMAYFRQLFPRGWLLLKQRHFPAITPAAAAPDRPGRPKRVLIVQQVLKHYRLAFFQQLAKALAGQGVQLTVAFSAPQGAQLAKNDNITDAEPGLSLRVPLYSFGPLVWQSVPDFSRYDVIVTEQANRHLLNYWLGFRKLFSHQPKLVFWGHGFNHQADQGVWSGVKEWCKRQMLRTPDAFFAYTSAVADYVRQQRGGRGAVTVLNNSIDTREFAAEVRRRRAGRPSALPYTLLFCGSLYPDKQLAMLLSVSAALVDKGLVQKLIVLGDGPDRAIISAHAAPWLDYRGACFAEDKAAAFAEADLVLNPGLVGLAILDAFAAGLPLVTTDFNGHSPEIAYLQHGRNGLLLPAAQLLSGLTALLQQPLRLNQLAEGATQSAELYSLDAMLQAFLQGLQPLLAEQPQ